MPSLYDWSSEPDQNSNSDEQINFREGQAPETLPISAMAMMARFAQYLADIAGKHKAVLKRINDIDYYEVTSIQEVNKYYDGFCLRIKPDQSNKGATSLAVGSLAPKPIYKTAFDGLKLIEGGDMGALGVYKLVYSDHLAGDKCEGWFLTNPVLAPDIVDVSPAGRIIMVSREKLNAKEWLICDGKTYNKKDWPELYMVLKTAGWAGVTNTTFKVPDLRSMFLRGASDSVKVGTYQEDSFKAHDHKASVHSAGIHSHNYEKRYTGTYGSNDSGTSTQYSGVYDGIRVSTRVSGVHSHNASIGEAGENETRPVNYSILYAIKT